MKEGYELELDIRTIWKCDCGHRQDTVEYEEWPSHCDKLMSIGATRQFKVVKTLLAPPNPQ